MSNKDKLVTCNCHTEGLAIFPARYTVIPTYLNKSRPSWATLAGVTSVPLNEDYQYHVRRVRAGYIYIYLPSASDTESVSQDLPEDIKIELENKHWLIYSIDEKGRFVKQTSLASVKPAEQNDEAFGCPNLQQNPSLNSFITIANPSRYSKVYIAYSEFPWTVEAMQEYRKSPLPRMQEIDIQAWLNRQQQPSTTVATEQTLSQILDFDFDFIFEKQLSDDQENGVYHDTKYGAAQKPGRRLLEQQNIKTSRTMVGVTVDNYQRNLKLQEKYLVLNTTHQSWAPFNLGQIMTAPGTDTKPILKEIQNTHIHTLFKNMKNYNSQAFPMLLAIEDALGVAEDLNNYYNDIHGHLGQFHKEAKMECDVKQYMAKIRALAESKVAKKDFDIAPYKDDLYLILSQSLNPDTQDYKTKILNSLMYKKDPALYNELEKYKHSPILQEYFNLDIEERAKNQGIDTNIDFTPPIKREFYGLVKSYILLVKEHFYGKPYGHKYYARFMNYLKYKQDTDYIYEIHDPRMPAKGYYIGSIYEQVIKYTSFEKDASHNEIKSTAQTLHQFYQKLVDEYASKTKEYSQQFEKEVDKELEKYTSRLDSGEFDAIVIQLNNATTNIAEKRAKLLTQWLQNSHYLDTINDLSFENHIKIDDDHALWQTYKTKIEQELQGALEQEEIEDEDIEALTKIDLNGVYFHTLVNKVLHGLESSEEGRAFIDKLYDLEQLKDLDVEQKLHIRNKFWVIGLRALLYDHENALKILKELFAQVENNKKIEYSLSILQQITIKKLSFITTNFRTATLMLEYITELQRLQKIEGLTTVTLNTSFGQKKFMIKLLSNYNSVGFFKNQTLKLYDKLISRCEPIKDGLYSLGAMIAEVAALAISGVVWKTGVLYAHAKYQLMDAWITFKAPFASGVNTGGGFKLLSTAYPAQAKYLIKKLRDNLNTAIKLLDGRFNEQLVQLEHTFKQALNIPFMIFSDATTAKITRKQIHLRSARLAFLVGAFEIYNWDHVMNKKTSIFANDQDILMEKMVATSTLLAAVSDFTAYSIRAFNKGIITNSFNYAKMAFGVFSGLVGFFAGIKMAGGAIEHFKSGNLLAGFTGLVSSALYFTSSSLSMLYGLTYRFEWVRIFFEKGAKNYVISQGIQKTFNLFALRVLLLRWAGIVGIVALVIECLYDWLADDDIQKWLSYSALGIHKGEQKYSNSHHQSEAFNQIDVFKAAIEEKTGINISELSKQSLEKIQLEHESILLHVQNQATQWLEN
ncbi:hypothetical protein GCM10023211_16970 [Orbus sasakiae]|uniref:Toxin VasX N-terminal region domain-containing protein n=1 Tax=Orbus sasakiae TaxID=1078475 RepID=A0ABP9ND08_9GAMM